MIWDWLILFGIALMVRFVMNLFRQGKIDLATPKSCPHSYPQEARASYPQAVSNFVT